MSFENPSIRTMSFLHLDSYIRGADPQSTWQMFHVFTLGAAMLGWHGVPTGFVPGHVLFGAGYGACPQAWANIASGFLMSTF